MANSDPKRKAHQSKHYKDLAAEARRTGGHSGGTRTPLGGGSSKKGCWDAIAGAFLALAGVAFVVYKVVEVYF